MSDCFELTYRQAMHLIEIGHYHSLGPYTTGYLEEIEEYYKRKGPNSYVMLSVGADDYGEKGTTKIFCTADELLEFLRPNEDDGKTPEENDIEYILSKRNYSRELLENQPYKLVSMLKYCILDKDKILESCLVKLM